MRILFILSLFALISCQREEVSVLDREALRAMDGDTDSCAACGMVVREQPAPRGQVIHRDGTRVYLCSLDDLVQYVNIPSPSGKPVKIYAETMPDDHALDDRDSNWHPWAEADDLFFVVGIDRSGVMGAPAMTYRTKEGAEAAAVQFNGKTVTFNQLRERNKK